MKKILLVFGTRPEAIKLAPLFNAVRSRTSSFETRICITAQHRQMLDQVMNFFNMKPDYDLNLMQANQTLFDITARCLKGLETVLNDFRPDLVIVQGDTITAFIGALAAYYCRVKVAHIEAGLRSGNKFSPFPEEANRIFVGHLADYHFVPTAKAKENLLRENISNHIYLVGNTVIDALFHCLKIINKRGDQEYRDFFASIDFAKRIILVTGHRRESFGLPFENICNALRVISTENKDVEIVYPVHPNPNIKNPIYTALGNLKNIHLIDPLEYPQLVWLMSKSFIVLTDSGGIQEEAPSLKKPVLVMREVTERTEGVDAGTAKLVGTDKDTIIKEVGNLLNNPGEYSKMAGATNPYGDGTTSERIVKILEKLTLN